MQQRYRIDSSLRNTRTRHRQKSTLSTALFTLLCLSLTAPMTSVLVSAFPISRAARRTLGARTRVRTSLLLQQPRYWNTNVPLSSCKDASISSTAVPPSLPSCCATIFELQLPQGRCVGLQLQAADALTPEAITNTHHWIHAHLHPQEIQYALALPSERNQQSFLLGRLALRQALLGAGGCATIDHPILKDEHGRPQVPPGMRGSISHKVTDECTTGVALVAHSSHSYSIGVDVEESKTRRRSVATFVLTPHEIETLGQIPVRKKSATTLQSFHACSG
jgi:4'-phosphopantetheinyl transferase EntD